MIFNTRILCWIFADGDNDEFVRYLESIGVVETVLRRIYGRSVISLSRIRQQLQFTLEHPSAHWEPNSPEIIAIERGLRVCDILEEKGFLDLDPEGVQEIRGRFWYAVRSIKVIEQALIPSFQRISNNTLP